ncbi:translation initiation factor IF-1 [Patescibacteria group bacterium]|nr:translation initiation factor IF-1 [Patescibacteria group bacterium]
MNAKDFLDMQGEVLELMPAATFKVKLDTGHEILAHLSGKMRMHRIRILPGDRVRLEISPYDLSKGRITFRL